MKKVLFIIGSLFLGLMLLINALAFNFYSAFQKITKDAVKKEKYTFAEQFYSYVLDENKYFSEKQADGALIEVYAAVNDNKALGKKKSDESEVSYYTKESCFQFSIFHLPKDFATKNAEGQTGGIKLLYTEDKSLMFPFEVNDQTKTYQYLDYFSFLPLVISNEKYTAKVAELESTTATLTGAEISDGNGKVWYTITFTNVPSFDNRLHQDYSELLVKYNQYQKDNAEGNFADKDAQKAAESEYVNVQNQILELNKKEGYAVQHSVSIVYKSSQFIWAMVGILAIFLAIDGLLGYFIFRPKRNPYLANNKTPNAKQPTQAPQQFSRNDIIDHQDEPQEAEEPASNKEEVVESPVEEVASEEAKGEAEDHEEKSEEPASDKEAEPKKEE